MKVSKGRTLKAKRTGRSWGNGAWSIQSKRASVAQFERQEMNWRGGQGPNQLETYNWSGDFSVGNYCDICDRIFIRTMLNAPYTPGK